MIVRSVHIQNVLSFKEQTIHLDGAPFLTAIGPNGSGKTNFIEILTKAIERIVVVPVKIDDSELWTKKINPDHIKNNRHVFTEHSIWSQQVAELEPNITLGSETPSSITISISLSSSERQNIEWLKHNYDAVSSLLQITGPPSAIADFAHLFARRHESHSVETDITFVCERNTTRWTARSVNNFSGFYVRWFKVLRWGSQLSIEYTELSNVDWPRLGELVSILGPNRSYHNFSNQSAMQRIAWADYVSVADRSVERSTKQIHGDEPVPFELFRRDICKRINDIAYDCGVRTAIEQVLATPHICSINDLLGEFLDLRMEFIVPVRGDLNIKFVFWRGTEEQFVYRLSSGEKALLQLIFAIYWSESTNITLLIDEPELHLHPQFHRSFVAILRRAIADLSWQVIVATHSPGFLCEEYPGSLLCFRRISGNSSVHVPNLSSEDKELMRLVDYDNSARLLFARKVVLVEGPTDAFFFAHFLRHLASTERIGLAKVDEIAFFAIMGKGERGKWTAFLNKLNIEVFAISDLDAVLEINPRLADPLMGEHKTQQKINNTVKGKGSRDGFELYKAAKAIASEARVGAVSENYILAVEQICERIAVRQTNASTIRDLANRNPAYRLELDTAIIASRHQRHMILRNGELENYIHSEAKGFDVITEFCRRDFLNWYSHTSNLDNIVEIQEFVREILAA